MAYDSGYTAESEANIWNHASGMNNLELAMEMAIERGSLSSVQPFLDIHDSGEVFPFSFALICLFYKYAYFLSIESISLFEDTFPELLLSTVYKSNNLQIIVPLSFFLMEILAGFILLQCSDSEFRIWIVGLAF